MALRKKGRYWYLYYRQGKRIVYKSLRTDDKNEAERNERAIMAQMQYARHMGAVASILKSLSVPNGADEVREDRGYADNMKQVPETTPSPSPAPVPRLPLGKVLETAALHRNMTDEHRREFRAFAASCGVKYADEVTPAIGLAYLDRRFGKLSAKRYNNALTLLNVVFRSCLVEAGLQVSPFDSVMRRRKTEEKHHRPFTREEQARIFAALEGHPYWRLLSLIALYTGLRLESCKRLCPSMIQDGIITIMPSKTARFGRAVQIPLAGELAIELPPVAPDKPYCSAYPAEEYLWYTKERTIFFTQLLQTLNISDNTDGAVTFHSWRVTYITRLLEAGIDERIIRGIVGHSSPRMTDLYNHDTESVKRLKIDIENALK